MKDRRQLSRSKQYLSVSYYCDVHLPVSISTPCLTALLLFLSVPDNCESPYFSRGGSTNWVRFDALTGWGLSAVGFPEQTTVEKSARSMDGLGNH